MESVHDAVAFIEQLKQSPDIFDTASLSESLRQFDAYTKHVLTVKVVACCELQGNEAASDSMSTFTCLTGEKCRGAQAG